ncbi:MAG: hypothetical protein SA339_03450 [Methanomassiliicoccus sp.]|nr:hypothetical protein [Methanomassiliicoccus sp.]
MHGMSMLMPLLPSKKEKALINKGDHLIYSVTGTVGDKKVQGALGIKFVAVKENEFIVEILPKGVPFMNRARLTFPWNGLDLSDLGGIVAGWSIRHDGERLGKDKITTPFGEREVEHYMRIEQLENGTLKTDQFIDPVHCLPYGARLSGKSGDVLFGLMETSLDWVKSDK